MKYYYVNERRRLKNNKRKARFYACLTAKGNELWTAMVIVIRSYYDIRNIGGKY